MRTTLAFFAGAALAGGLVYITLHRPVPGQEDLESVVGTEFQEPPGAVNSHDPEPPATPPAAASQPPIRQHSIREFQPPSPVTAPSTPAPLPDPPIVDSSAPVQYLPAALEHVSAVPPPEPNRVRVREGTVLPVTLSEDLSSEKNLPGDLFTASLDSPLVVDGFVIAERGSRVEGRVAEATQSGKVKGRAALALRLTRLYTSDGQRVDLMTETFTKNARPGAAKDAARIGGAAGIGALIGGIAGGGTGAAIGAAIGGAAGTGVVLATRGPAAAIPAETRIPFRVATPVTITEQIH